MRRDILEETLRLLVRHFDLFTMIALTVWLPGHLVINYLDFFTTSKGAADTEFHVFEGKGHSLTIDNGWKEVADVALNWLASKGF